jgi:BirA family biotin operon repressor/biotin-[acetyl-CoA-carboxylase] ligase
MRHVRLHEIDSTYSYLEREAHSLSAPLMVTADVQSAGRGQRGNKWESQPYKNITAAILWTPSGLLPQDQFAMSEAVALAVCATLRKLGVKDVAVKWPNDIYVGDRKISGILIKHSLSCEAINYSIIGIGVNLNQELFVSDAPNPVSVKQLTGNDTDINEYESLLADEISGMLADIADKDYRQGLHQTFLSHLWRYDGETYRFKDIATESVYNGIIEGVEPNGYLHIHDIDHDVRHRYAFKEVAFIL